MFDARSFGVRRAEPSCRCAGRSSARTGALSLMTAIVPAGSGKNRDQIAEGLGGPRAWATRREGAGAETSPSLRRATVNEGPKSGSRTGAGS